MNALTRMKLINSASSPQGKWEDGDTPHLRSCVDWRRCLSSMSIRCIQVAGGFWMESTSFLEASQILFRHAVPHRWVFGTSTCVS